MPPVLPATPAQHAADLHWAVNRAMRDWRGGVAGIERRDFEEQFAFAEDDPSRIVLCERWLELYQPKRRRRSRQCSK